LLQRVSCVKLHRAFPCTENWCAVDYVKMLQGASFSFRFRSRKIQYDRTIHNVLGMVLDDGAES